MLKIQDEEWYQELSRQLSSYKWKQTRIEILADRLTHSVLPTTKCTASYGDKNGDAHDYDKDEAEYELLRKEVNAIGAALKILTEIEHEIIKQKFFERKRDVIIYEMLVPMAPGTYYKTLNSAMRSMYKVLK